jgi:hypothetical protein
MNGVKRDGFNLTNLAVSGEFIPSLNSILWNNPHET